MIKGFDLSHWQKSVNFKIAWDAGIRFALIKCTESNNYVDDMWKPFYNGANNVGMVTGLYHYWRPEASSLSQVDHIRSTVGKLKLEN